MSSLIELPNHMPRSTKVLLVMDVVESVRIMEQDQDDFVRRWQQLVQQAEQQDKRRSTRLRHRLSLMEGFAAGPRHCLKRAMRSCGRGEREHKLFSDPALARTSSITSERMCEQSRVP